IARKVLGDREPITCRPADLIEPELEKIRKQIGQYIEQDEDVLSYALFPQVAENFFKQRQAAKYKVDGTMVDYEFRVHPV
ncbi:MAG TPA: oxaloacetate decarboxylase subunit alpha, partial [Clostridiales bacterium]|nr:oxaloacetate decarboxylase subunit alpha [Clostridiales bacterium]